MSEEQVVTTIGSGVIVSVVTVPKKPKKPKADCCVKCGSEDVKVCEPNMCGPCYVAECMAAFDDE